MPSTGFIEIRLQLSNPPRSLKSIATHNMSSLQLLFLFVWSLAQQTVVSMPQTLIPIPAPEVQGSSSTTATSGCGGCYLVADVVGLVWYSEILKPVVGTQVVSVAVGNGTNRVTSTVFTSAEEEFTYTPGGPAPTGGSVFINFDSTYEIAGNLLYVQARVANGFPQVCGALITCKNIADCVQRVLGLFHHVFVLCQWRMCHHPTGTDNIDFRIHTSSFQRVRAGVFEC